LLPLCLSIMTLPSNAAKDMPVADPVPSDKEAEDVEAIRLLLEAAKAKNKKIALKKKGARGGEEEVPTRPKRGGSRRRPRRKGRPTRPKSRGRPTRPKPQRVRDAEEARKRKVSTLFLFVSLG